MTWKNNLEGQGRHETMIRNAADIVETLLRDESSRNTKTKSGLADLTSRRRRRPSTTRSSSTTISWLRRALSSGPMGYLWSKK